MNNKIKKLIILLFAVLFTIFLLNIFIKKNEINKSDIINMNILNYIPSDYAFTILSNSTNNDIRRYINENIPENKRDKLNTIKESTLSYLGFNLQGKIENIYDNEFALTFFRNELKKMDILLIFKVKENIDINNIINIGEDLNKSDQIIELKRFGKLNYISHIYETQDKYIIASSDKKLIDSSLNSNNSNEILSSNLIPDDINLKKIKLLSISEYISPNHNTTLKPKKFNKLITIINSEDKKIKLRSFSPNINQININKLNNQIDNIKSIIFTNNYSTFKKNINFLYNDIDQKELLEEIYREVNEKLLFITNNNKWVLCFKNKLPNKILIDQFNSLNTYKKEDLYFNSINYSIYTNNRLEIKDNDIIYEEKSPIFSLKKEEKTYISNDFDTLLNITKKATLSDEYLNNNSDIRPYKYILNDVFYIKDINNKQLIKFYKSLKNLKYFINTEIFSLEDININISQVIPENYEKVYLESNLKIL